jgi:N-acetylmuramic acid 6-phosphate (MurNAc-6-P) etherase
MARLGRIKNGLMVAMKPTNIKLVRRKEQMDEYLAKITDHTTNEII